MKHSMVYRGIRKLVRGLVTRMAGLLPPWKKAPSVELLPPLLKLPVAQPVNLYQLSEPFTRHFIAAKHVPNRRIFVLRDVYVNGKAVVFKNLRLFLPSLPWLRSLPEYRKGSLLLNQWLRKAREIKGVETVALVYDDWSANNYYHWMIESLPRLLLVRQQFPDCQVIVPDPAPEYIRTSLQMLGINKLLPLQRDKGLLRVTRLALPELVYYYEEEEGAFLYDYQPPKAQLVGKNAATTALTPSPEYFKEELVVLVRKALLQQLQPPLPSRKVYASRSRQKTRRLQNEDAIWPMLQKWGFERVYFEEMSFLQQIQLMLETRVFLGVHGANMVNILFLQPQTCVLEMMNEEHFNEAYYLLASSLRLPYYSIPCTMANESLRQSADSVLRNDADLLVDTDFLEKVIEMAVKDTYGQSGVESIKPRT